MDEIVAWQGIGRSPQISDLLRYVVDKTLAGDEQSIKAYSIAVDVLGRPTSFDPQSDPIVRVQARRLRSLLEEFYASGRNRSGVEIRLPLGRYVPEFLVASPAARGTAGQAAQSDPAALAPEPAVSAEVSVPAATNTPDGSTSPSRRVPRFAANMLLGFGFTVIGVALAVGLVRWMSPAAPVSGVPVMPQVTVTAFDNLTGDPVLDDDVTRVSTGLAAALAKFEAVTVVPSGGRLTIRGTVQEENDQLSIKVILAQGSGILWSTALAAPLGLTDSDALNRAVLALAAQLANASGPLHASGRAWLKLQTMPLPTSTLYLCQLEYMQWRDSRQLADADTALACFDAIIAREPDNPAALAAWAGADAWRESFLAKADANLVNDLTLPTTRVSRAVFLAPDDSFVNEQQALVLGRQGSIDAALGSIGKAMELNPANLDATGVGGIVTWLSGDFDRGSALGESAIAGLATPPPWYYMTRGFEALREKRYFDAVGAGLALAAGDEEFGPVIVLAAAQRAGRMDLVDRFRPIIMGNPRFQESGILPRLGVLIRPQVLLDRIREGLTVAGIPPNALDRPFKADGTPLHTP